MLPTDLEPHPEGGHYREVFRSIHQVDSKFLGQRSALTHIYFQLDNGDISKFHKVSSEEVWNLYKGEGIRLYQWDGETEHITVLELSAQANRFCHVVPAHHWQAAEPLGESTLLGCSVAPGFDFQDFTLLRQCCGHADVLKKLKPELKHLIE